jgi:hypothetical protein
VPLALLEEFPDQVLSSHALVVTELLAKETVTSETFFHLAAELLSVAKVARLCTNGTDSIEEARGCWQVAFRTFEQSTQLWERVANDDTEAVQMHRRLLQRLCAMAVDQLEIYDLSESGRTRERY